MKSICRYWEQRPLTSIFVISLLCRLFFVFGTNMLPRFSDTPRYEMLSDQILKGDFNHDSGIYIISPLFSFYYAALKWLFGKGLAAFILRLSQCIISTFATLSLYKMSINLFNNTKIALLTSLIFAILPLPYWYVGVIGQDSLFQSFFIISLGFFTSFLKNPTSKPLIKSAFFYGLTFLTKSHILLWSPFIALSIGGLTHLNVKKRLVFISIFALISLTMTLPFGLYNKSTNDIYVLSSVGIKAFFYTSNNEVFYQREYLRNKYSINLDSLKHSDTSLYINEVTPPSHISTDSFLVLRSQFPPMRERQELFMRSALDWWDKNPEKFWAIRFFFLDRFLVPGVNAKTASQKQYFLAFFLMFPIYIGAYFSILKSNWQNFQLHNWSLSLFWVMLCFAIIFYSGNRFRTITLEAIYIVYAVPFWFFLIEKVQKMRLKNKISEI